MSKTAIRKLFFTSKHSRHGAQFSEVYWWFPHSATTIMREIRRTITVQNLLNLHDSYTPVEGAYEACLGNWFWVNLIRTTITLGVLSHSSQQGHVIFIRFSLHDYISLQPQAESRHISRNFRTIKHTQTNFCLILDLVHCVYRYSALDDCNTENADTRLV